MAAFATKTIKLKADTRFTNRETYEEITVLAGTEALYHEEESSMGRFGVVCVTINGDEYAAVRPLKPCNGHCNHATPVVAPEPVAVSRTIRNERNGQTLETTLTNAEAAARFAELYGSNDSHWVWFWIHRTVNEARPTHQGGSNVSNALDFIADSFVVAVGYGLKRPMIRVHYKDQRFKFYLSAKGTICVKTGNLIPGTQDPTGDEEYMGCLLRGKFLPARSNSYNGRREDYQHENRITTERKLSVTETEFLAKLGENPVAFLAQCSKDMSRCCYCYSALEDARSKAAGFGPTCASRWGLAWGDGKHDEKTPSFAKSYNATAHGIIGTIRSNPADEQVWAVFGDWLEEQGLKRCSMPEASARLPRND